MKKIAVLGSTGSVGKKVLEIVSESKDDFDVVALGDGGRSHSLLEDQIRRFQPKKVCVATEKDFCGSKDTLPKGTELLFGEEGMSEIASIEDAELIFMAIGGTAALRPLVKALRAGKNVALASKEPMISAGELICGIREQTDSLLIPVDSEHSALADCIRGLSGNSVRKLYITGSGGSLHRERREDFDKIGVEKILDHPKWDMGRKITVDSATLMNKALEMIEAKWLFNIDMSRIELVIHPEAVVHAIVELSDGTQRASFFNPDMRYPVARALYWPEIPVNSALGVDISSLEGLSFMPPDLSKFPALDVAMEAMSSGGTAPAVLNGSNEEAVALFLDGKIPFTGIVSAVRTTLSRHKCLQSPGLEDIISAESWAKEEVRSLCSCGL